jgi:DNA-binding MarR family transcriptional regulator
VTFAKISSDSDFSPFPEHRNATQSGPDAHFAPSLVADTMMECAPVIMHFIRSKLKERPDAHVSVAQIRVLGFIYKHPGCSLTYLSDFLGIASPSASTMIDRLVKAGMVIREVDPTRRRNLILHLTAEGEQELKGARTFAIEELSQQFAALPSEQLEQIDRSMTVLKDLLSTIYENVDEEKIFKLEAVRNSNSRNEINGDKVKKPVKNKRGPV